GRALENFACSSPDTTCKGKVLTFVNVTWYMPEIAFNESGDIASTNLVADTTSANKEPHFAVDAPNGVNLNTFAAIQDAVIGNLKTGYAKVAALVAPSIKTDTIAPTDENTDLALQIGTKDDTSGTSGFGKVMIQNGHGETVATVEEAGNGTFGGILR